MWHITRLLINLRPLKSLFHIRVEPKEEEKEIDKEKIQFAYVKLVSDKCML